MIVFNSQLAENVGEILELQAEIKLQENKYASLLQTDQSLQVLKEIRLNIKYLKDKLMVMEERVLTLD
jgi:hypothetical protein